MTKLVSRLARGSSGRLRSTRRRAGHHQDQRQLSQPRPGVTVPPTRPRMPGSSNPRSQACDATRLLAAAASTAVMPHRPEIVASRDFARLEVVFARAKRERSPLHRPRHRARRHQPRRSVDRAPLIAGRDRGQRPPRNAPAPQRRQRRKITIVERGVTTTAVIRAANGAGLRASTSPNGNDRRRRRPPAAP